MTNMPLKLFLLKNIEVKLTDEEQKKLPKTIKIIGHVGLIRLDPDLEKYQTYIAKAILKWNSRIKTVAIEQNKSETLLRNVNYKVIFGEKNTKTVYIENGIKYVLDPTRITFSLGNQKERLHLYNLNLNNKVVIDMFACVGQFSFPVAIGAKAKKVIAIEINPDAFSYLVEGIKINKINNIIPILGDSRNIAPKYNADLIIMGFLHSTHRYFPSALKALNSNGGKIIMHIAVHDNNQINSIIEYITYQAQLQNYKITNLKLRTIKMYSPAIKHIAFEINLKK